MYTNKTGSTLNFNLYKGGRRYSRKRKSIKKTKNGGGNWFKRPETKLEKEVGTKCESVCLKNANDLCSRTCKEVSEDAVESTSGIIDKNYLKNIITENKTLKDKLEKLEHSYEDLEKEHNMIKRVYKIPTSH